MGDDNTVTVQVAYSPCLGEIGTTKEMRRDEAAVLVAQGRVRYTGNGTTLPAPPQPGPPPAPQPGPPPAPHPGPAPGPPVVVPGNSQGQAPEPAPAANRDHSRAGRQHGAAGAPLSAP